MLFLQATFLYMVGEPFSTGGPWPQSAIYMGCGGGDKGWISFVTSIALNLLYHIIFIPIFFYHNLKLKYDKNPCCRRCGRDSLKYISVFNFYLV